MWEKNLHDFLAAAVSVASSTLAVSVVLICLSVMIEEAGLWIVLSLVNVC